MPHVPQDELLASKANEIRTLLEKWAIDKKVLKPREQIVFLMEIKEIPFIVQNRSVAYVDVLDMRIMNLLTVELLTECSNPSIASKVRKHLFNEIRDASMTVRDFMKKYPTQTHIRFTDNLGKSSARAVGEVLGRAGIYYG